MKVSSTKRREYISKYCEVLKNEELEKYVISAKGSSAIIAMTDDIDEYIRSKDETLIDFLVHYGINEVYSTRMNANYGYSEKMQSWWGWDGKDRGVYRVGTRVTFDNGAYCPEDAMHLEEYWRKFWTSELYESTTITNRTEEGFVVECRWSSDPSVIANPDARGGLTTHAYKYPKEYGKGAWTAKTLDDAKEMAMDFAKNQLR